MILAVIGVVENPVNIFAAICAATVSKLVMNGVGFIRTTRQGQVEILSFAKIAMVAMNL